MTHPAPDPHYGNRQAWYLVFSLTLCNILSQVDRFAMTLLVTPMQRDLGLNDTQTGLIGGRVTGLFYALAGLPLARLADQYNRKLLILVALTGWSLMTRPVAWPSASGPCASRACCLRWVMRHSGLRPAR